MIAPTDLPKSVVQAFINSQEQGAAAAQRSKTTFMTKLIAGLVLYLSWTSLMVFLLPMGLPVISLIVQSLATSLLLTDIPRMRLMLTLREDEIQMTPTQTVISMLVAIAGFPVVACVAYKIYFDFHGEIFMVGLLQDARRRLVEELFANVQYWNAGIELLDEQDGPVPFRSDLLELAMHVHGSLSRSPLGTTSVLGEHDAQIMTDLHLWREIYIEGVGKDQLIEKLNQVYPERNA